MGMALSFNNNRQCSALYQLSNQSAETTLLKIKHVDSLTLMFVYDPKSTLNCIDPLQACMPPNQP